MFFAILTQFLPLSFATYIAESAALSKLPKESPCSGKTEAPMLAAPDFREILYAEYRIYAENPFFAQNFWGYPVPLFPIVLGLIVLLTLTGLVAALQGYLLGRMSSDRHHSFMYYLFS